jgi:aspartate oxidase
MIDIEQYKRLIEESKSNMSKLMEIQNETMKILATEKPELFTQMSQDLDILRNTKDLNKVNEIMQKYANSSNTETI